MKTSTPPPSRLSRDILLGSPRIWPLLRDPFANSGYRNSMKPGWSRTAYRPRVAEVLSLRDTRTLAVWSSREWGASPALGCAEKNWRVSVVVSPRAVWHDSDFLACGC